MAVELVDGSTIMGRQYVVGADRAKITLPDETELQIPASAVRTVRIPAEIAFGFRATSGKAAE